MGAIVALPSTSVENLSIARRVTSLVLLFYCVSVFRLFVHHEPAFRRPRARARTAPAGTWSPCVPRAGVRNPDAVH